MNIGLDMMGGDFAPLEAVKGAAEAIVPPAQEATEAAEQAAEAPKKESTSSQ